MVLDTVCVSYVSVYCRNIFRPIPCRIFLWLYFPMLTWEHVLYHTDVHKIENKKKAHVQQKPGLSPLDCPYTCGRHFGGSFVYRHLCPNKFGLGSFDLNVRWETLGFLYVNPMYSNLYLNMTTFEYFGLEFSIISNFVFTSFPILWLNCPKNPMIVSRFGVFRCFVLGSIPYTLSYKQEGSDLYQICFPLFTVTLLTTLRKKE